MTEQERQLRVRVLEETALAYFRKGDRVQYDARNLTHWNRYDGGPRRRHEKASPEDATVDSYLFTVCSSFLYNCLYDAFRYELCGSEIQHTCKNVWDGYREFIRYEVDREAPLPPDEKRPKIRDVVRATLAAMREGDILLLRHRNTPGLHVVLRISGDRVIHCWGARLNMVTGEEKWESGGSIRMDPIDEFLLSEMSDCPFTRQAAWCVIDVLSAIDPEKYPIQPWTLQRLKYPGLDIDRYTSVRAGQTVRPGDVVTVTVHLENCNPRFPKTKYEPLTVEEILPEHTTLLPQSLTADTVLDGNKLRWTVTMVQGEERIIQYSFRVNDDVRPGDEVVTGGGNVGGIPSNTFRLKVGAKRLDVETCRKLQGLADRIPEAEVRGDGVAEWVYEKIGRPVKIPKVEDLIAGLYEFHDIKNCLEDNRPKEEGETHPVLRFRENPDPKALETMKMMAPKLIGGTMLACVKRDDRVLEFRGENLYPGDVILVARELDRDVCKPEQWVILGGGKVAVTAEGKTEVRDLPYMDVMLATRFFVVLRPSNGRTIGRKAYEERIPKGF